METTFYKRPKNESEASVNIQLKHQGKMYRFSTPYFISNVEWFNGYPKEKNSTKDLRDNLATAKKKIDDYIIITVNKYDRVPTKSELDKYIKQIFGKEQSNTIKAIFERYKLVKYPKIKLCTTQQIDLAFNLLFAFNTNTQLADINKTFADNFTAYINKQGYLNQTTNKHLKNIKTFLNWCYECDLSTKNLSKYFTFLNAKDKEIIALSSKEITILENGVLSNERLNKARDLFLFACYTSLSYTEVTRVHKDMIVYDEEAKCDILSLARDKTGEIQTIPIWSKSKALLDKYNYLIPVISNVKINLYIKEVFVLLKLNRLVLDEKTNTLIPLNKAITYHIGRKSFITIALSKGMHPTLVKKISGHKSDKSFNRYINFNNNTLASEMQKLES